MSPHTANAFGPREPTRSPHEFPNAAAQLRRIRSGHFWFEHRTRVIFRELARVISTRDRPRVLDLGCGDASLLEAFPPGWIGTGIDDRWQDLMLGRRAGVTRLVAADARRPPFADFFDVVGLFDVLEHVEDDRALLEQAARLAAPKGWIVATVPAGPRLWSALDEYAGHYRRYTKRSLRALFERAGLQVHRCIPIFRALWPLAFASSLRSRDRSIDVEREYAVAHGLNSILRGVLAAENWILGACPAGFGTSLLACATPRIPA